MTPHPLEHAGGRGLRNVVRTYRRALPTLLLIALPLLSSCKSNARGGGRGGFQMPPTPVEVTEVQPQRVRDQFRALGSVEADEIVQVTSEANGIVRRLPFVEGQGIRQGAVIALLDDREQRAELDRAAAQRVQANSNFGRASRLSEQNVISKQELDDTGTALRVAEAGERVARARLSKTVIRAPFSGVVGRRRVSVGAYVRAGDVITEMARLDDLRVTFSAPERSLGRLQRGVPVEVSSPAFPGEVFAGRISVVDPMVDPQSRTVQLVARIPNPGRRLKPGMSANVSVTLAERGTALVVPDEAVFAQGNQSFVYVVKADSTVALTAVQLGARDSARVEVTNGLTAGQTVVTAGHQKLFDGAHVMPMAAGMAGTPTAAAGAGGSGARAPGGAPARGGAGRGGPTRTGR